MAFIFQYGSNLDVTRINSVERLGGRAIPLGVAELEGYQILFNVWSKTNNCAVTNIERKPHLIGTEKIFGVLFHIPDDALSDMRRMEGVNSGSYQEIQVMVMFSDGYGNKIGLQAYTYVGAPIGLQNFMNSPYKMIRDEYLKHILKGMDMFHIPPSYRVKVEEIIKEHNKKYKELKGIVQKLFSPDQTLQERTDIIRLRKPFRGFLGVNVGDKVKVYGEKIDQKTGKKIFGVFEVVKGPDEENHPYNYIYVSERVRNQLGVNIDSEVIVERF